MNVITLRKDAHWYDLAGNPRHTVMDKSGVSRPTTLKDARKNNWLPSVTTYLEIFANPGLNVWQRSQDIMSALTMPDVPGESLQDRAQRVQKDSERYMREKAEWGQKVHSMVEQVCRDQYLQASPGNDALNKTGKTFEVWFTSNVAEVIANEKRVVNKEWGYAGTADFIYRNKDGQVVLADFKTPAFKGKDSMRPHDKWGWQLAAYSLACGSGFKLQSIMLPSDNPDCLYVHDWEADKRRPYLEEMAILGIRAWRTAHQFPWNP